VNRSARVGAVFLAVVFGTSCAKSQEQPVAQTESEPELLSLAPAPPSLRAKCVTTARAVGYPVPCPTRVPPGLAATRTAAGRCSLGIIGPGGIDGCHHSWRRWVIGSSETSDQHLVLTATPRPVRSYARVVNGPAWYPRARVRPLDWVTVGGQRMRAVYAPRSTNGGSAFSDHVVLIWTTGGHTYGIGFHNVEGIRETLELDEGLAGGIELVRGAS
jgi:hypothetical protein